MAIAMQDHVKKFVYEVLPYIQKHTEVLPSVVLSQSCIESGYGSSLLAKEAKNIFGMKADSSWTGESFEKDDNEYYGVVKSEFRVYNSWAESIEDYYKKLKKNYPEMIGEADYRKAVAVLDKKGYCTDPDYGNYVASVIDRYNFHQFNNKYIGKMPIRPNIIENGKLRTWFVKGDTGVEVENVQKVMNWAMQKTIPITSVYDDATMDLVGEFQKKYKFKSINKKYGNLVEAKLIELGCKM